MKKIFPNTSIFIAVFLLFSGAAQARQSVLWEADSSADGTGTGTLQGGIVTYNTIAGRSNVGITVADDWNASLATDTANVSYLTGGVLGTTTGQSVLQTIYFSQNVFGPGLLINFADEGTSLNFGSLKLSLADSNNAQFSGGIANFIGATDTLNDGFVAVFDETFGPGKPLTFYYSSSTVDASLNFTIATSCPGYNGGVCDPLPEPSPILLIAAGGIPLLSHRLRRS